MRKTGSMNVKSLADLIEADIRHRRLQSGDQYLNSVQTARRFSVSTGAANSALQLLAQRKIVKRKQRLGTFVTLSEHQALPDAPVGEVHLMLHKSYLKKEGLLADGVVVGIQSVLPKANIQLDFLPTSDEGAFVDELIHATLKNDQRAGFVVVRASLETQRAVGRSGLPAVIHGTTCPSVENVSSLDRDNAQSGKLIIEYFAKHKCKNILVLLRNQMQPGHNVIVDAFRKNALDHGISTDRIVYRFLPTDDVAAEREVLNLAGEAFKQKCGVICDARPIAEGAIKAIAQLELPERLKPELVSTTVFMQPGLPKPTYPYIYPEIAPQRIGERIGELLVKQASGKQTPVHATYPVALIHPGMI
ncbi:hypothetical protein [Poriferisphaera sp. WC338]|uniref:hypothetical protein n=1 Tax=Poriferisphaera sp. WC338 TaxID=3425129 RepID=UPI003D813156